MCTGSGSTPGVGSGRILRLELLPRSELDGAAEPHAVAGLTESQLDQHGLRICCEAVAERLAVAHDLDLLDVLHLQRGERARLLELPSQHRAGRRGVRSASTAGPVSYTHLTLPTS